MRRALLILGVLLACLSTAPTATASAPLQRGMWVWDRPTPSALMDDALAAGLTDLYLSVSPGLAQPGELTWVRVVSADARAAGIRVWALGGDPTWTMNPTAALNWQRAALGTGLFDGSHVDIEPWALSAWATAKKRPSLVTSWEKTLARLQQDSALPLHADIPFWAEEIRYPGGTMADAAFRYTDQVTVMSYRDSADGVLAVGQVLLAKSASTGHPLALAVETNPLSDCTYCTFSSQSQADVAAALTAIDSDASASSSAYVGVSIHDHHGWLALTD